MKKILITGATGFIGKAFCTRYQDQYELLVLSRDIRKGQRILGDFVKVYEWDARTIGSWINHAEGCYGIINLSGENVGKGRWSESKKSSIYQSRLNATRAIIEAVNMLHHKPSVVIYSSAVGFYGNRGNEELDENSTSGKGFLAGICKKIENLINEKHVESVRKVIIRTGVVLSAEGGAMMKLTQPFKYYLGGYIGNGKQWLPWISMEDQINAMRFLLENDKATGLFNLTAPNPVQLKTFCKHLGKAIKSPCWTFMPGCIARLLFGQKADELLLTSQKVKCKKLLDTDFEFRYKDLKSFLNDIKQ